MEVQQFTAGGALIGAFVSLNHLGVLLKHDDPADGLRELVAVALFMGVLGAVLGTVIGGFGKLFERAAIGNVVNDEPPARPGF